MTVAPEVALSETFLTALGKMPKPIQKKVREFTFKFRENPTSSAINYESLQAMRDAKVRSVRIDLAYRAIVVHPPKGNLYMLVWVDHHDEAMAWAKDKVFDIHGTTGAIQVLDMAFVDQLQPEPEPSPKTQLGLFGKYTDEELALTGLPAVLVPAVRAVMADDQLDKLQPYLPQEAFEALYLLACGYDLEHAVRESARSAETRASAKSVDTTDFAAALQHPATRRQFRLIDSDAALREMLDASLDKWRVFLHPNQESIVTATFRGPARVLGGAGTGKTVVAMHRARHLAKLYPNEKVLFTTYNRNLATNISELLKGLCGPEGERIEVANIHAWAMRYARRELGEPKVVNDAQAEAAWNVAVGQADQTLDWTRKDYESEWDEVVQFFGVDSLERYLKASRTGCSKSLKRAERAQVWKVLAAFRAELDRQKLVCWADVIRRVRMHLESAGEKPYRAIIVDEAQDIDAEEWRLLRALAPEAENSLFITGDAHQRIYGKPVALSQFDIQIRGRSRRLKLNYRTTEQVLRWATEFVQSEEIDDLDGGTDNTIGYRSVHSGPEPELKSFASPKQEAAFLIDRIRDLATDTPLEEIAIVAKFKNRVNHYARCLQDAGLDHTVLDGDKPGTGVRVATMHRVKGLEFSHVLIDLTGTGGQELSPRDRSLLYVAATRCRKTLTVLNKV